MAGAPQPNAFIPLDLRTVDQFGFVKQAAKEAEREVVRLEKEIAKAYQSGKNLDQTFADRLQTAKQILKTNESLLRQWRENKEMFSASDKITAGKQRALLDWNQVQLSMKQAIKESQVDFFGERGDEKMFKFFATSAFARRLFKEGLDAETIQYLVASRALPGLLEKAGFIKAGKVLGAAGPALQLAVFAMERIKAGFAELKDDNQTVFDIGRMIGRGDLPPAMIKALDGYNSRWYEVWKWNFLESAGAAAKRQVAAFGEVKNIASALAAEVFTTEQWRKMAWDAVEETGFGVGEYSKVSDLMKQFEKKTGTLAWIDSNESERLEMIQDLVAKANLDDKMQASFDKILGKNVNAAKAMKEALKREAVMRKTPAETYHELEFAHLRRTWGNLKRYDLLGQMARDDKRTFVRD